MRGTTSSAAKKILGFSVKDRIEHSVFGLGTITQIDNWRTTITFDESGSKKFVTSMVQIKPSDAPRPSRARKKKVVKAT